MVRMGLDNPQDSFSTHFNSILMFLAPTGTLASQDLGLAWLWTSPIAAGKSDPLSEISTSFLSQQQTSALSQQLTSILSQHQTPVLSQQKPSILSQQRTSRLDLPALELAEFWPGTPGILRNYMVSGLPCGASPTTRSGQDDCSSTNSLKLTIQNLRRSPKFQHRDFG